MIKFKNVIAVGDCNTLGAGTLEKSSYPERFGKMVGCEVTNLGHTMATTREGVRLLRDNLKDADCVIIQFGLVDSYKTFKYSPYILYYPDNILRKQLRSIVKKFKKTCRKIGLNDAIGEVNVVSADEYEQNIRSMIELSLPRIIVLLDTVPNKELYRNSEIQRYNSILTSLSEEYPNCIKIDLYDIFYAHLEDFYLDKTHCNENGYTCIAEKLYENVGLKSALLNS